MTSGDLTDQQYGVRWLTSHVSPFPSRKAAQGALDAVALDPIAGGVLVVRDYEPGTGNASEWREANSL